MLHSLELKTENRKNPLGIDCPKPVLSWILQSDSYQKYQTACQIQVATSQDLLEKNQADMWDSKKVFSDQQKLEYNGKNLEGNTIYYWHVRVWDEKNQISEVSEIATFETAFMNPEEFLAKWIAASRPCGDTFGKGMDVESNKEVRSKILIGSLPMFAKEFSLDPRKKIIRARAYVSGLGIYDLKINGKPVTKNMFEPGETDYSKEIFYVTYDITDLLENGQNAIGVTLGKGFYLEENDGKYKKMYPNYGELMLKAQLFIVYEDGTSQTICTDESFVCYEDGPVKMSSWTGGEDYDATCEVSAYSLPGYDYTNWKPVRIVSPTANKLMAKNYPPIVVKETFSAVFSEEVAPSVFLIDFGRNFAGVARFRLQAPRGTTIELWPSELLKDGRITQRSTGTPIWDTYTFKGEGIEEWAPQFCYHGFRYLEVRVVKGHLEKPEPEHFTALLMCCDNEKTGEFGSSSHIYNTIHKLIMRSVEANMFNTVTDCPHREKLGWQEVSNLMFHSIASNYDIHNWMKKIANDMITAQHESGLVPDICPEYIRFQNGFLDDPSWGGSCIYVPYYIYKTYGDERQLRASYPTMQKYVKYLEEKSQNDLLSHGLGDWGGYDTTTPRALIVSCTYYGLVRTMEEITYILEKPLDGESYKHLAERIKRAINAEFFDAEKFIYGSGSQASIATPLYHGIVESEYRRQVAESLVRAIQKEDYHITTGEIALKPMLISLSQYGYMDVVVKMLLNKTMPSYLYFVEQNATTLPEFWDMKESQLHCMMGHAEEWFYEYLAGIRNTSEAYKTFEICPYYPEDMEYLSAKIKSIYGDISLYWERQEENRILMKVNVPCNTTASVSLGEYKEILGSGKYCFKIYREVTGVVRASCQRTSM